MSRRSVWFEGRILEQDSFTLTSDEKTLSLIRDLVQQWAQKANISRQQA
jgi:hypothetical protein